jgi:biopolymer transport protein ExbB
MRAAALRTQAYSQSYPQKLWVLQRWPRKTSRRAAKKPWRATPWFIIPSHCLTAFFGDTGLFSIIQAAGWPIWLLIVCSIVALALVIERFVSLQTGKVAPPQLLDEAIAVTRNGLPSADVVKQLEQSSALGSVLASGLRTLTNNPRASEDDLRAHMEGAGRMAAHRLERYLAALGTIASAAPLLGLFGTVVGMIEIFGSQAPVVGTAGAAAAVGGGNPQQLAHGISVALYNTAFGLIVAIPALIFWRYFRGRVDGYVLTLELASERFARHLLSLRR